jgi:hypothetical protein
LSKDATCVLGPNDRVKILSKGGFKLQDGTIISEEQMAHCKWMPGFTMYFEYNNHVKKTNHANSVKDVIDLPVEATNTTAPLLAGNTSILDSAHTLELSKTSNDIDPNNNLAGVDSIMVAAVAVAAATTIAAVSISNVRKSGKGKRHKGKKINSKLDNLRQQQQKKEEEQKNCSGKSEKVQAVIDETNEILAPVEQTINNFDGIKENKELTESISDIKQELKKLKKTIKDLE